MILKYKNAKKLAEQYMRQGASLSTVHLAKWINVLEGAGEWQLDQQDKKLDAILAKLEKKTR